MSYTYRLINVGRGKFNGTVIVDTESQLLRECRKHLASNGVEIIWQHDNGRVGTIAAGFHSVGKVEQVERGEDAGRE